MIGGTAPIYSKDFVDVKIDEAMEGFEDSSTSQHIRESSNYLLHGPAGKRLVHSKSKALEVGVRGREENALLTEA